MPVHPAGSSSVFRRRVFIFSAALFITGGALAAESAAPAGAATAGPATAPAASPALSAPPGSALAPRPAPVDPADPIFEIGRLHRFDISLSAAEWTVLQRQSGARLFAQGHQPGTDYTDATGRPVHISSGFGGHFPWVRTEVKIDGRTYPDSGLRYRGNGSFSDSSSAAPLRANLKIKFDVFGGKGTWNDAKNFNFNAGTVDISLMRESIAFALFRLAGVPAPRTAYARIHFSVPGIYENTNGGFYVMIEDINKPFIRRVLPPGNGLLMKPEGLRDGILVPGPTWAQYENVFRPDRPATPAEQKRLMEFAGLVSQTDVALFRRKIGEYLDVDLFLRFIAVNAFIENWDSYLNGSHNFHLYLDPTDNRFRFIPWDQDHSMGSRLLSSSINILEPWRGGRGTSRDQPLIYWLLDDPAVMARYRGILKELSATAFSLATIDRLLDEVEKAIGPQPNSPRYYLRSRAREIQNLVQGWNESAARPQP